MPSLDVPTWSSAACMCTTFFSIESGLLSGVDGLESSLLLLDILTLRVLDVIVSGGFFTGVSFTILVDGVGVLTGFEVLVGLGVLIGFGSGGGSGMAFVGSISGMAFGISL